LLAVHDCLINMFTPTHHICWPCPPFLTWACTLLWQQGTHIFYFIQLFFV